jgi:hypothetical protein
MLQEYVRNILVVSVLCYSACFHGGKLQVFYLMLHMFHTYVVSVCSKWFICFIRMLHSNVSCCTCFILFEESTGAGSDDGTTLAPENGPRRARGRRLRCDGARCACGTRWTTSNPGGQGVLQGRGESFGRVDAATGRARVWGRNKNQHHR